MVLKRFFLTTAVAVFVAVFLLGSAFGQVSSNLFGMHENSRSDPWPTTVGVQFTGYRTHDGHMLWSQLNPQAGSYDWTTLDAWMAEAKRAGNPVLFTFFWTPQWASSKPGDTSCAHGNRSAGGCDAPNDLKADGTGSDQHVKDFMTALMKHVGPGAFKYIEIWNEYNTSVQWTGTEAQLVRITKDVRTIAKAYDPNVLISSPPETGDWSKQGGNTGMRWLGDFLAAGGGKYIDVVGFHGHVAVPESIIGRTNSAVTVMAQYNQTGKPLLDTEAGWIGGSLPFAQQRGFLFREYLDALSTPVQSVYVYGFDYSEGLSLWNRTTKQLNANGVAYKLIYNWLVRSTLTSKCQPQVSGSSVWSCTFTRPDGTQAMAIWDTAVTYPNTVTVSVPSKYVTYYTLDGSAYSVAPSKTVQIGYEPIWLEN